MRTFRQSHSTRSIWVRLVVLFTLITGTCLLAAQVPRADAVGSTAGPMSLEWSAVESAQVSALAWGDVDGDGDLDLASVNACSSASTCRSARLYLTGKDGLLSTASWASANTGNATSVAWGDVDGDGDLDLAVGHNGRPILIYRNQAGTLAEAPVWTAPAADLTTSIAWGDADGDGDLDLAVGNGGSERVYRNDSAGTIVLTSVWVSSSSDDTKSIAWGDADGDGDLDLAVGNNGFSLVYQNRSTGAGIALSSAWVSTQARITSSITWGDIDSDGDLDLAFGNGGNVPQPSDIYRNNSTPQTLAFSQAWSSPNSDSTTSMVWGDYDNDGDPDLAVGNFDVSGQQNRLYRNDSTGTTIALALVWSSNEADATAALAWGDYDNDGDLDLAAGNSQQPSRVYRNGASVLTEVAVWASAAADATESVAWGDVDGDGDLDLAVGNNRQANRIYVNTGSALATTAAWSAPTEDRTTSVAWGDVDGDGDLDLAVGNTFQATQIYRNTSQNGAIALSSAWSSVELDGTSSVAWGDVDGDGDLDLATGVHNGPTRIYRNESSAQTVALTLIWSSAENDDTTSIAWGDVDGDGDLDLATGNTGSNRLYRNEGGTLAANPIWNSAEQDETHSVAWGDVDGDGDLDLAVGNIGPNRLYQNNGGVLLPKAVWSSVEADYTSAVAWGDADGDGDLDLAVGNTFAQPVRLYHNDHGVLPASATWSAAETGFTRSIAWGDVDGDGDLDLATGNTNPTNRLYLNGRDLRRSPAPAPTVHITRPTPGDVNFFGSAVILSDPTITINYTLAHPRSQPVQRVIGQYSLDGGDRWLTAQPTPSTQVSNLATTPSGAAHAFTWDVLASGVMGRSDNVVFRLIALPDLRVTTNRLPGPFLYGAYASQTFPFRVRGSQVRVQRAGAPVEQAIVYRLAQGQIQGAVPLGDARGEPFRTDTQGYLEGRGTLAVGDTLIAAVPVLITDTYSLLLTNATPTQTGLSAHVVQQLGVQDLQIGTYPLLLLNLDVSLEWDARSDLQFLTQLRLDLQRTSELLYDWSDGQVALGEVRIFHEREAWDTAHLRIYATNRLRPNANQGGIVSEPLRETVTLPTGQRSIEYSPGQIRMGAIWNRFGDANGNLGEDWPRTLAHEMSHYALFLDDNYLGLDSAGRVISVAGCRSAMSDPYRDDYSEFHPPDAEWQTSCANTLSALNTGRSDWETIKQLYDGRAPGVVFSRPTLFGDNPGPNTLPLAVTHIQEQALDQPRTTLSVPLFSLTKEDRTPTQPDASARAFLFPAGGETLIDLGRPVLDQVTARGARPGDRLCVFDLADTRLGCQTISASDAQLTLVHLDLIDRSGWKPDVIVTPVTSRTVQLQVRNIPPNLTLWAKLYPSDAAATTPIALAYLGSDYTGTFNLPTPAIDGYVQIWVDEPGQRREIVTDYTLGGNPGFKRSRGAPRGSPGFKRSRGAPLTSGDGQVILFGDQLDFDPGEFFTIQVATHLPSAPAGRTFVSQGYWLQATAGAPDLQRASLNIGYAGQVVPPGEERGIGVYYWNGTTWSLLETILNQDRNEAAAAIAGPGLYALMSSIPIALIGPAWNNVAFSLPTPSSVRSALAPIAGAFTVVYGYTATDASDPWKLYSPDAPGWVNDLALLQPGQGYWIYATRSTTLYLSDGAQKTTAALHSSSIFPPATFYGEILQTPGVTPTPGMRVEAFIGSQLCGETQTHLQDGRVVFAIEVAAEDPTSAGTCGAIGRFVTIHIGAQSYRMNWDNRIVQAVHSNVIYLPIAAK